MEDIGIILINGGTVPGSLSYQAFKLTDEMEVVKWDNRGIVLELKHSKYGDTIFKAIKNVETQEFVGYADSTVHLASRRNKVATPSSALLPLSDNGIFIPATSGTDKILGTYKRISATQICKRKVTWPYTGSTIPPFSVPLIEDDQGNINLPPEAEEIVEASDCEAFSTTGTNFYNAYKEGGIDQVVLSEISDLITQLDDDDSDIKQAMIGLGSFPSVAYPQQQTTWSSETEPYNDWGNAQFKAYRDYIKAYIRNFKENKEKIQSGGTAEKMCQVARALDIEALKVLTTEEKLRMLEPLALQPIEQFWFGKEGFNEEFLVLKIVSAFDLNNPSPANTDEITKFLDGLKKRFQNGESNKNYVSLFELLYNRVDDAILLIGGEDNRKKLVFALYALWVNSNYNPYRNGAYDENVITKWGTDVASGGFGRPYSITDRPALLNYQSVKSGGIFYENFSFLFSDGGDGIYWVEDLTAIGDFGPVYADRKSTTYDFFQPISLLSTQQDTAVQLPPDNNYIPPFFLKYVDDKGDDEDFHTQIGFMLDVASIISGIGAIAGLRHLRTLSQLGQLALGILELSSGSISFYLNYTDNNCDGDADFCDKLKRVLFWVEVASLSGDFLATQMARRSASDIVPGGKPTNFDDDPWNELVNLADINKLYDDFIIDLNNRNLTDVVNKLNGFTEAKKHDFYFDFKDASDEIFQELIGPPDLIDEWEEISELIEVRQSVDFLSQYRRIRISQPFQDHLYKGDLNPNLTVDVSSLSPSKTFVANGFPNIKKHRATGLHSLHPPIPSDIELVSILEGPNANGYYLAKYRKKPGNGWQNPINNSEYTNPKVSTFFPDTWSQQKINEEVALALSKSDGGGQLLNSGSIRLELELTDGTNLIVLTKSNGDLITAYPEVIF